MAEEEIIMEDKAIALEDTEESIVDDIQVSSMVDFVSEKYQRSEDYRSNDEERWLRAYRNYRGLYGSDVQFTEAEKSRVFIKVTKTKTLAAYGQIADVLFAGGKFPINIEPTELPEGVVGDVSFDPKEPEQLKDEPALDSPYGFTGDGKELPAGATAQSLNDKLGPLTDKLQDIDNLREGVGQTHQRLHLVLLW